MTLIPGSLFGRAVVFLIAGLVITHLLSMFIHYGDETHRSWLTGERELGHRLVAAGRALDSVSAAARPAVSRSLSADDFFLDLLPEPSLPEPSPPTAASLPNAFEADLIERLRPMKPVVVENADRHVTIDLTLSDGALVRLTAVRPASGAGVIRRIVLELIVMVGGIVIVSIWAARWLTYPLTVFSAAAERIGRDLRAPPIHHGGLEEIKAAADSFNAMQDRLRRLVDDRTQMLAAISHDLRTPITRLRLRGEFVDDDDQRVRMMADLDEMERMIDSALSFARDEASGETQRRIDLTALIESVCHDAEDAGYNVSYTDAPPIPVQGRPLALKRGFANLVNNAVMHGGSAEVSLRPDSNLLTITICDRGPGIPSDELEAVFRPFYRFRRSSGRKSGGSGLGLAVARSVFRAHGGAVRLENRAGGGLCAVVTLPR